MSDNDLIRRGDVAKAITTLAQEFIDGGSPTAAHVLNLASDRINALPAAKVTVKLLEWDQLDGLPDYDIWEVLTTLGRYKVQKASWNDYALLVRPDGTVYQFPTLEAAKAATQADYDARIRSALTVTPHDPAKVRALVEAAEKMIAARNKYEATPTDRGGAWGTKGKANNDWRIAFAELDAMIAAMKEGE